MPKQGKAPTGIFADVSYVQRLATKGGKAPTKAPTAATDVVEVGYTAIYRFQQTEIIVIVQQELLRQDRLIRGQNNLGQIIVLKINCSLRASSYSLYYPCAVKSGSSPSFHGLDLDLTILR